MRRDKVLVAIANERKISLAEKLARDALAGWDATINLIGFDPPKGLEDLRRKQIASIEDEISRCWNGDTYSRIFVDSALNIGEDQLKDEGARVRITSHVTIYRELVDELMRIRLHWKSHAEHQWRNSGISLLHPVEWRNQFAKLGCEWVAEGLLKQIRVISDHELRTALQPSQAEWLGLRVAHAFVADNEPGSSSTNIKDLLEHTHPADIFEVDLTKDGSAQFRQYDVLYLYEDGLWSGVELVKRLANIAKWDAVAGRSLKVVFRFGVTSDAGLYAGRHFLRREGLTTIDISAGIVDHHRLLKNGSIEELLKNIDADDEKVRKQIDAQACAYAFEDVTTWGSRAQKAQEICQSIGIQLTRPWLLRTKGSRDDDRAAKWSLGALGFASLTAFSKSVPKPVLPLLWLEGAVTMNDATVDWRPLYWDVRRTGTPPPTVGGKTATR